ncbi:hypothetical protein JXA32_12655 [Candidatus Sumerlaeota bacterium]|nr:hypothetical protein [Candidatus Sumerlaeota bacterium]
MSFRFASACCIILLCWLAACEKVETPERQTAAQTSRQARATPTPEPQASKVRRAEKTAWRMMINGQIAGKGKNEYWGQVPGIGKLDLGKSSYNTYLYSADVAAHIHVNNDTKLEIGYVFNKILAQEIIGEREIRMKLQSRHLPPLMPKGVKLTEETIEYIERNIEAVDPMLPPSVKQWIDYGGEMLAFRSEPLDQAQDSALGLNGKKVRVIKTVGRTIVQGLEGFEPTRAQRDFIDRLSLTADVDLFPEDKKPGDQWIADAATLGFVFDPLISGDFRGPVSVEYVKDELRDGFKTAVLKIRKAPVEFIAADGSTNGQFDGWGEVECLMPGRLIVSINLKGNGEFKGFPADHLLYGMQYEGQPEYEAVSSTQEIDYNPAP